MGRFVSWDASAITALNPGLPLPHLPIVVYREDGSGTTFNFANDLSQVNESWRSSGGTGLLVDWPVGVAAKRNGGVANTVNLTPGAGFLPLGGAFGAEAGGRAGLRPAAG